MLCYGGVNVAIETRNENEWMCWMDIPERDVLETVTHQLYDDDANAQAVTVHVWDDDLATPDAVLDAVQRDDIEMRP